MCPSLRAIRTLAVALAVAACGSHVPSSLVPSPQACAPLERTRVLAVELSAEERVRVDAGARVGLVLVHADACGLTVVPDCRAPGSYAYRPDEADDRGEHKLATRADLRREIPFAEARLADAMSGRGELHLSVARVGELDAGSATPRLEGNCGSATHFVRGLGLGAFRLARRGGGGGAEDQVFDQDGKLEACGASSGRDAKGPVPSCDAIVSLDLLPLSGAVAARGAASPFLAASSSEASRCGPGMHYSDLGDCVANTTTVQAGPMVHVVAGSFFSKYPGAPVPYLPGRGISEGSFSGSGATVRLDMKAFEIDLTEVTVQAYKTCVDAGRCTVPGTGNHCTYPTELTHPVNCVDWKQAKDYCEAAGRRLPSPHEWEYAARGSDSRVYPWGSEPATPSNACVDHGRLDTLHMTGIPVPRVAGTCPVGSHPTDKSPFGALDMGGNVREWTGEQACVSHVSPCMPGAVQKGGAWTDFNIVGKFGTSVPDAGAARSTFAEDRSSELGFRCAR